MISKEIHSRWWSFARRRIIMPINHFKHDGTGKSDTDPGYVWRQTKCWFIMCLLWQAVVINDVSINGNIWFHAVNVIFPSRRWKRDRHIQYLGAVYPQISRLRLVLSPGGAFCTRRWSPTGSEPVDWTWTLAGSPRKVRSSWFSSTLQPPLMREQWRWTKAVYTVQTQPWAAAHWLILRCVWERRGTPFSSFVLVSVNSVVGGRAHCGGQCFVLTLGLAQLVPRVQPEDSWIMERESSGPREFTNLTCLIIKPN